MVHGVDQYGWAFGLRICGIAVAPGAETRGKKEAYMVRMAVFPLVLFLCYSASGGSIVLPASTSETLLVDDVTLPGFSAGYNEIGYAVFDVQPGHYGGASFELSIGGSRSMAGLAPPTTAATITLQQVPPGQVSPWVTFFNVDRSGPSLGRLSVTATSSAQVLRTPLSGNDLLSNLDRGGEVAIVGLSPLGPNEPSPLCWTGAGSPRLLLDRITDDTPMPTGSSSISIPEPQCGTVCLLALLAITRRADRRELSMPSLSRTRNGRRQASA